MTGGSFTDNSATTDGGAISIRSNCTATLSSTVFSKNTAAGTSETQGGGAIYVGWGTLTLNGVTMTGNSAENGYGGAVNANNASFSVEGGSFTQNSAISGGAIYLASNSASVANVKNASFSDNTATNGTNIKCGGQQTVATENGTFTEV